MIGQKTRVSPGALVGPVHPRAGGAFTRWLGRAMLALMGWKIGGNLPDVPKAILVGAPHTSNNDLSLAIAMRLATGLDYNFMMKREAFRWPLGPLWKSLGGVPIDRSASRDRIQQTADWFDSRERAYLGITPEGTRSRVDRWKTGYLRIAQAADIPVMIAGVDGARKTLVFDRLWPLTGDIDADNTAIRSYVRSTYSGMKPHNS